MAQTNRPRSLVIRLNRHGSPFVAEAPEEVTPWEPVAEFVQIDGSWKRTDRQQTDADGVPLWQRQATLRTVLFGSLSRELVTVQIAAATRPDSEEA